MKSSSMRPALFILLALGLSASTIGNVIGGSDSAVGAGEHLGAAILISWFAVGVVGHLVDNYRNTVFRREAAEHAEERGHQARRSRPHHQGR
jgi:hypothetical protein